MPAGLPMAGQGPDRDGLFLDQLHVPFGPFLVDWPAGLVVRLILQGDVIQQADVDTSRVWVSAVGEPFWAQPWVRAAAGGDIGVGAAARRRAAAHLDSLGRFLAVAGWPAQALSARRLRDDVLAEAEPTGLGRDVRRFTRQVGRSRTLYWLTRGLGELSLADALTAGVSGPAARADGDVSSRYRYWLTAVEEDLARLDEPALFDPAVEEGPRGRLEAARWPSEALVELLPRMLIGTELAAARLIVASLDPDPDELASRRAEVVAGG